MKPIVITGARGYIGSALAARLAREGHALRLVSRSQNAWRSDIASAAKIEYVAADLRDERAWHDLIGDAEVIVHLSCRTDLRAAEANPSEDDNLNVEPTRALVRAAARLQIPKIAVFAGAVTIVGDRNENPVNERTPDLPCSVYDRHKLACEEILREATNRGLLRACSLRLSNVYGFGGASINSNRGVLNLMMKRAAAGEPLSLFGDGSYVRDFIHIDDVVEAFCAAITSGQIHDGRHYVVATGKGHSLREAFALIGQEAVRRTGRNVELRCVPEPPDLHPIERRNFVGDSRLFQELTGWRARIGLEAGIGDYFARAVAPPAIETGK